MTFYVQTYPYRRMARRWAENRQETLRINVREDDEAYVLSALVPGISSDELNIQVLEDVVRIDGEYKAEESNYLVQEFPAGSFTRSLRLPAPIDAEHVEADVANGVLTLRLPKAESARPKQIKINAK
jgi:HSP20 family protein